MMDPEMVMVQGVGAGVGARVGGAFNNHFANYALSRWHCWPASDTSNLKMHWDTEHPFTFTSNVYYSKALGIEPDLVEYFSNKLRGLFFPHA